MNIIPCFRKFSRIAVACAVFATITACGTDLSPQEHLARAHQLQLSGDLRAAVLEYKLVLQKEPENLSARWSLGQAYLALGDGQSAEKEFQSAQKLGKDDHELNLALAQAYLLGNNFKLALETLDKVNVPLDSDLALVVRGEAALGLQDLGDAEKHFRASLQKAPQNFRAHRGLGKVALMNRDFDEADKHLDQALSESKRDAQSWTLKGEVALSRRDAAKAEIYFAKAIALDDNSFSSRVGLVRALLEQQKTAQAKEHLSFLNKNLPENPLVNYLTAVAATQSNELSDAKSALLSVRNVQPNHLPSILLLGSVHYLLKEYDQAAHELSRYLKAEPDHLPARKLLAATQLQLKQPDRVIETLADKKWTQIEDAQLLSILGSAYVAKGEYNQGMSYLEKAAALAPDAKDIRLKLAGGQLAQGDSDKAIAELSSAIEMDPDFLQAELMLGLIYLRKGEFDLALDSARKLATKQPGSPLPYNLMAAAYEGKKDFAQARTSYKKALTISADYTPALLNLARMDLSDNDMEQARQRYTSVLEIDKNNEQALLGLAKIAKDEGRYQDALQLLDKARWHNPTALQPRLILAEIHLREGDPKKALSPIEEAAKLAPDDPRVLVLLGQSQLATGNRTGGRSTFEKLVKLHPQSADAHFKLSVALLASQDVSAARASLQKAIALDKGYLPAKVAMGNLELQTGNVQGAESIARQLISEHPSIAAGHVLLGDLLMFRKLAADAKNAYQTAYALSPNRPLLIKLYRSEEATGNRQEAIARLRTWIDNYPKDTAVRLLLAQTLHQAGRVSEAISEYETVIQLQRNNVIALNNLAGLYLESNGPRAIELAKQAHDLAPERPDVLDTYGWVLVKAGDPEQGVRILKTAVLGAPDNRDIRFHLAAAHAQIGKREQAHSDLKALLSDGKPFTEREAALALLNEIQKQ